MDLRTKAQNRIIKWKNIKKMKGWEINALTGVDETAISRLFNGRGIVSEANCQKVLAVKEPK